MTARRRLAVLAALVVAACGEPPPVAIGFLGGVSGRVADLGVAGRNGTQLAVEAINAQGGIGGRRVELHPRDDEQTPDLARRRFLELAELPVAAVVGPMTSGICAAVKPLAEERRILLLSPTCTANELGGGDDHFMRVISPTSVYGERAAAYQYEVAGSRAASLVYDLRNKAYTESWANDFATSFGRRGGRVVGRHAFESGDDAGLADLVEKILPERPDLIVLVANSVDAALLTQQIRQRSSTVRIAAAEWASTERFVELAGRAAEGVGMAQFFDRNSQAPAYVEFRGRYRDRFGDEPGFGGAAAYDAAMVLFTAMRASPGLPAREAILARRRFDGLQGPIVFDANGDAQREVFATVVRDGRFVAVRAAP